MRNLEVKKTKIKLANGSILVHIFLPHTHSGAIAAFVKAGHRFDPENLSGLAHFMEHITLAGTKKYPSAEKLHKALEQYGAWYEAFTYHDYVQFTIQFAGDYLEKMVENLAQRLVYPLFKEEDIKVIRGNILQELYLNKANPQRHIWNLWQETIWQETSLARNYLGTEGSLSKINKDGLIGFYNAQYGFNNTVFLYAGNRKYDDVARLFSSYFGDYRRLVKTKFNKINSERKNPVKIYTSSNEQTTFAFGFKTEGIKSPDYHIVKLLQVIVGLNWSSRLVKKLFLKKGFIYTWFMNFTPLIDNGYFMFQSACSRNNTNKVLEIIVREFRNIKESGVGTEELERAKSFYQGDLLANTETPLDFIHWYGRQELFLPDKVEDINDRIKKIQGVTKDDIVQVAQKYFTDKNWYLALVGNIKEEEIKIPALF